MIGTTYLPPAFDLKKDQRKRRNAEFMLLAYQAMLRGREKRLKREIAKREQKQDECFSN